MKLPRYEPQGGARRRRCCVDDVVEDERPPDALLVPILVPSNPNSKVTFLGSFHINKAIYLGSALR